MSDDQLSSSEIPMRCSPSIEDLYRYMDGQMEPERQAVVQSHIDACGGCGEVYRFQLGLRRLLGDRCSVEPPPDLSARIFGSLGDPQGR